MISAEGGEHGLEELQTVSDAIDVLSDRVTDRLSESCTGWVDDEAAYLNEQERPAEARNQTKGLHLHLPGGDNRAAAGHPLLVLEQYAQVKTRKRYGGENQPN